ncbi:MAG TPA: hypothetical protein VFF15_07220 [Flavobacteriaceae bacterium]|nr:hypothetical protein [Flavobacteriaceae bacterium]
MKKIGLCLGFLLLSFFSFSQETTYTVNHETLELKTEVEGKLDLLWNIIDGKYRYFVKTEDNTLQELQNTKDDNSKYREQYKTVLNKLTGKNAEDVDLTLFSLKEFIKVYNESVDSNLHYTDDKSHLGGRLSGFIGLTNSPFVENPENTTVPLFGAELEFFGKKALPRHAGFFSVRHALDNDDFQYSETQLALGYRYRILNQSRVTIYGQVKLVTYSFSKATYSYPDEENEGQFITEKESGSTFEAPLIFGLGADIKLTENSFITLVYGEIFAAFLDSQGNFPVDFAIGYKFNL